VWFIIIYIVAKRGALNTRCSALLARVLSICNQQAEACASLLAFAEDFLVGPDAAINFAVGKHEAFVAVRVPPAANPRDDFPDRLANRRGWKGVGEKIPEG
jgi:hypothetical protein